MPAPIKKAPPKKVVKKKITPERVVEIPAPPIVPTQPKSELEQAMVLLIQSQTNMQKTLEKISDSIEAIKNPPTTQEMLSMMAEKTATIEKQYQILVVIGYEPDESSVTWRREIYDYGEKCDSIEIAQKVIANKYPNSNIKIIEIDTPVYK